MSSNSVTGIDANSFVMERNRKFQLYILKTKTCVVSTEVHRPSNVTMNLKWGHIFFSTSIFMETQFCFFFSWTQSESLIMESLTMALIKMIKWNYYQDVHRFKTAGSCWECSEYSCHHHSDLIIYDGLWQIFPQFASWKLSQTEFLLLFVYAFIFYIHITLSKE